MSKAHPDDFEETKYSDKWLPHLVTELWRQIVVLSPEQAIRVTKDLRRLASSKYVRSVTEDDV